MQQVNINIAITQPRKAVTRSVFAVLGSLWFGGLLLMLLVVGMASATVFESAMGAEQALAFFYKSRWFRALLALLGVNIFASLVLRYPFTRRHFGFVLTHGGLLVIIAGALVTRFWGVDGQLSIVEGQTADTFHPAGQDVLALLDRRDQKQMQLNLDDREFGGFVAAEFPHAPALKKDDLSIEVTRYLPDSTSLKRMVDDNPRYQPAVEVSLSASVSESKWIFADQSVALGPVTASYRVARDANELDRLLAADAATIESSVGSISIASQGKTSEIVVEDCTDEAVRVGDTGLTVRVLRYLPHAIVGADRQMTSASDKPLNPAVEVELIGPDGTEKRICFARFPDFQSMHGKAAVPDVKITFHATQAAAPTAPLEIIGGPNGRAFVRFTKRDLTTRVEELKLGDSVPTPWGNHELTLHRRFEHARMDRPIEPVEPVRKNRMPAILLKLTTPKHTSEMWVQRGVTRLVSVNGAPHEILYGNKAVALGFTLKLNSFKVLHYPGGQQPRSFESDITVANSATGDSHERVVSMNHPVKYGGFTLYQTSYRKVEGGMLSVLSVSRDPGKLVVFAGYILTTLGMIVVLNNRLRERRLMAQHALTAEKA